MSIWKTVKTIIGSVIGNGTSGSILFIDSNKRLAEDNPNLFYDYINKRVGLGTITPESDLAIHQNADNLGLRLYGFDDKSTQYGDVYISNLGAFHVNSTQGQSIKLSVDFATKMTIGTSGPKIATDVSLGFGNSNNFLMLYKSATGQFEIKKGALFFSIKDQGSAADIGFNTDHLFIDSSGRIGINEIMPDAMLEIVTNAATEEGLKVKGSISQTGNLIVATDSSDLPLFSVLPDGSITTTGVIDIPITTSTVGQLTQNGSNLIHTFGTDNFFAGKGSGNFSLTSAQNTAIGTNTLSALTIGNSNTAIGATALTSNTSGSNNVAIGISPLRSNVDGINNISIGTNTLFNNVSGLNNIAIGKDALFTATGSGNSAIGTEAMKVTTTGINNIAFGSFVLANNTSGSNNVAIGPSAMSGNTTANNNIGIGVNSLFTNQTGTGNIAIGKDALSLATLGNNLAIGLEAGKRISTGQNNIALGSFALDANTTANNNIAIGVAALSTNVTSTNNVAVGTSSLSASTGASNTAIGKDSLQFTSTGAFNTALGTDAGDTNTTGSNNIFIGASSDCNVGNLTNAIAIGTAAIVTTSNTCVIGRTGSLEVSGQITGNWKIGSGRAGINYTLTFDGETNNGVITYLEDEDQMQFASTMKLDAGVIKNISTKTADYTIVSTDYTIVVDGTSNTVTITLPATPNTGQIFTIKCKNATFTVTLARNGKTIDGDATDINLIEDESVVVQYDGTGWQIL